MQVAHVTANELESALDPADDLWHRAQKQQLTLFGAPVALQPTEAIRESWANKTIGAIQRVRVAAVHDGQTLLFHLEWQDPNRDDTLHDTTSFMDAAAILLPAGEAPSAFTMGAPGQAVNAWYWRADNKDSGHNVVAEGIGSSRMIHPGHVRARGVWTEGQWQVVIGRVLELTGSEPLAQLEPGLSTGFAVAIWEGSHGERAGIKSISGDFQTLHLEAARSV